MTHGVRQNILFMSISSLIETPRFAHWLFPPDAFFFLNGYSVSLVNYRGSRDATGRCGKMGVDDVVWHIDRIRNSFAVEKRGVWW
jgi:hypothetical protein